VDDHRLLPARPRADDAVRRRDKDERRHREAHIGERGADPRCPRNHAQFGCKAAHASLLSPRWLTASITAAMPPKNHPSAVNAAKPTHGRSVTTRHTGQVAIVSSHENA